MIVIFLMVTGAVVGTMTARRRGGNRLDMLQYGAVFCILFGLIGLFLTIIVERLF